ncbi:MAG: penicillin acylase family protein [Proteobacteria bacterium]|nr:penicillin acylase family protein [Pseudomonadota bacterium]
MKIITCCLFLLLSSACAKSPDAQDPEQSSSQSRQDRAVRIVRDNYGTPHIHADTVYGLYFGYGYSIAQDRLFQMEMARRSTQGTVAEVLGLDYVDYDKNVRQLFDPASIQQQLDALNRKDKDVFAGYAAGMNAWLAEIRKTPGELTPKQFIDLDFTPDEWTGYDVAMIFIGTMNNRYGDFNTELENAAILNSLVEQHGEANAHKLFDLLNPRFSDDAPTTIPRQDWSRAAQDSLAATWSGSFLPLRLNESLASPVTSGMSNCYVLGKDKVIGASSILVNGPQFGWFNPSYVYSVGMHGAGIDVVGNSPFGYPMIMFGHNATITWGSTWGASDIVDIYAEQLNPDDSTQYLYMDEYIDLRHRNERISIRGVEDVVYDVYRSVHGPIVHFDVDAGIAYAKHRAWDGRELETLLAWLYATWAVDFAEWKAQAEKSAINVNMYYADVDGNIGFFHGGWLPQRAAGHDNRFPVTGDGSMDWQGRQSIDVANPHVLNPVSGYLANWNNKPGQGVMNPDFFFYSWSAADRVAFLHQELSSQEKFTADEAWAVIESSSYADVFAAYFRPLIDDACGQADDPRLREANEILQDWNRQSRDDDMDGYYDDAATAIFRTFMGNFVKRVLEDDLGAVYPYFAATGYPTADAPTGAGTNIQTGVKAIVEALAGRAGFDVFNGEPPESLAIAALRESLTQLREREGQAVSELRLPVAQRPFATSNFLGIPQAGEGELMIAPIEQNRGTENNMIVMKRDAIVGYEVTPPGQNAFISPDGDKGEHYDDQFEMYYTFGKKRLWFYPDDVENNKKSETLLTY